MSKLFEKQTLIKECLGLVKIDKVKCYSNSATGLLVSMGTGLFLADEDDADVPTGGSTSSFFELAFPLPFFPFPLPFAVVLAAAFFLPIETRLELEASELLLSESWGSSASSSSSCFDLRFTLFSHSAGISSGWSSSISGFVVSASNKAFSTSCFEGLLSQS